MKDKISYGEAIAEVEAILERLGGERPDVDNLAAGVRRATELIALCRERLRAAEDDVAKALKEE
jgi:exodeoxyribonuclease VII small subunit